MGRGGTLRFVIDIEKTASTSADHIAGAKALIDQRRGIEQDQAQDRPPQIQ